MSLTGSLERLRPIGMSSQIDVRRTNIVGSIVFEYLQNQTGVTELGMKCKPTTYKISNPGLGYWGGGQLSRNRIFPKPYFRFKSVIIPWGWVRIGKFSYILAMKGTVLFVNDGMN
jgi:hypothetical protein